MKIIGFFGQANQAKDTSANYLCEKLGDNWYRGSLASKVKKIFCEAFNVSLEFVEKWKRINEPPPGFLKPIRESLIFVGDGFRDIMQNCWIDNLLKNNDKNLIISDGRYISESNYMREHNGITILLYRPSYENDINSRSEQEVMPYVRMLQGQPDGEILDKTIPFDFWLVNDKKIEDLYDKIDRILVPYIDAKKIHT